MSSNKYDLFSPEFKADPFPTYAAMRAADPVYPHAAPNGATIWYITRYADVAAVLRDDVHFCKDRAHSRPDAPHRGGSTNPLINTNMLFSDPPDHTRLRHLVNQAFTPRRVEGMAGRIQQTADLLLEEIIVRGEADLIGDYALPLPVVVISDMLGIPAADRHDVADWSQAIISPGSRGLTYKARKQQLHAFVAYLQALFADRRADPQDDLISALLAGGSSTDDSSVDTLSESELSSMVALLLVTGHETTVNLIGNGTLALLQHPAQRKRLRDDPSLWPTAVEELLRYDGPVETSTSRWVRRDMEMGGRLMPRGDQVRAVITSANRDPGQFERPDELDIGRRDNKHLSFGLGSHYCLGAPLARLEAVIGLQTLFARLPELQLQVPVADLSWRSGVLFRGLCQLPVGS